MSKSWAARLCCLKSQEANAPFSLKNITSYPKHPGNDTNGIWKECQDAMELPFIQGIMQRIV